MTASPAVITWMLDADPALRWQVERDIVHAPEATWRATRARVASEGMARRLLDLQDPDGQWAGGAFFPRGFDFHGPEAAPGAGQPWTATTWTLNTLRDWGVEASDLGDTAERLAQSSRWEYDDLPYWHGEVDVCINAWTLMNGVWLGADVSPIVRFFREHRLADGGYNCEWVEGSTRSSVASTLNAITGLLYWEQQTGDTSLREHRLGAQEYLLERRLLHRLSTGEPLGDWTTHLAYPFRAFYSALHALDTLRATSLHDSVAPDPRLEEAVETVRAAQEPDGTWVQQRRHPGRVWFEIDVPIGEPSPWLTMYATRILEWWESGARA